QSEWKEKMIRAWISIGGSFGGSFKHMYAYFGQDDPPIDQYPFLSIARKAERTYSSSALMLPRPSTFGEEVLVRTPSRVYTSNDYMSFFEDLGNADAFEYWKDAKETFDDASLPSPGGFDILCLVGKGQRTLESAIFSSELSQKGD